MPERRGRQKIREAKATYEAEQPPTKRPDTGAIRDGEWIQANRPRLERRYPGRWIAVHNQKVVGVGVRLTTALKQAKAHGVEHPFVVAFRPARLQGLAEVAQWL